MQIEYSNFLTVLHICGFKVLRSVLLLWDDFLNYVLTILNKHVRIAELIVIIYIEVIDMYM